MTIGYVGKLCSQFSTSNKPVRLWPFKFHAQCLRFESSESAQHVTKQNFIQFKLQLI